MTALPTTSRSSYLMESQTEAARLEAKTDAAVTGRLLSQVGLREGMRALDAGAGTGAVARVMSKMVGPSGSVVALDRSEERLKYGAHLADVDGSKNLSFESGDIEAAPPGADEFDFVWCRFVFEYLREADLALANLIRATRIGGKVIVADLDHNGTVHYPVPHEIEIGIRDVAAALDGRFDPFAGRRLYSRFRRAGLDDVRVHMEPYNVYAGVAPEAAIDNWSEKLKTIRPAALRAFADGAAFDRWASGFLDVLRDPDVFSYSMLIVVEGIRR